MINCMNENRKYEIHKNRLRFKMLWLIIFLLVAFIGIYAGFSFNQSGGTNGVGIGLIVTIIFGSAPLTMFFIYLNNFLIVKDGNLIVTKGARHYVTIPIQDVVSIELTSFSTVEYGRTYSNEEYFCIYAKNTTSKFSKLAKVSDFDNKIQIHASHKNKTLIYSLFSKDIIKNPYEFKHDGPK